MTYLGHIRTPTTVQSALKVVIARQCRLMIQRASLLVFAIPEVSCSAVLGAMLPPPLRH